MMSAGGNGGPECPSHRDDDAAGEQSAVPSTSDGDPDGRLGFCAAASAETEARVSLAVADGSVETRVSDDMIESRVLEVENEDSRLGDACEGALESLPTSSVSRGHGYGQKNTDVRNGGSEHKKVKNPVEDYDSMLSEFDYFAAKGASEAVGFGYEIGDMVWGKVKSHPWWPGHIYNEAFASPSVQRSKREGHVLVAFFGDSSYGWFDPAELVPFEENFAEKSRQTSSRAFVKAVEEAVDELSRRRGLGLVCRCRNEFNFGPSTVDGYFVVDVGDYEPGIYSSRQINKSREGFQPKEMLSFVQQLALTPTTDQHWTIEFIKSKATVLGCRKALFEEFDETYAQAFGTVPVRPPRPTAPMAVDPSKAPLSGRLVFAEALDKGKLSVKPTKSKDQVEKDKYLFVRRDAPIHMKSKKTSSVQGRPSAHPLLVDGSGLSGIPMDSGIKSHMHQISVSGINDGQQRPSSDRASVISGIKYSEGSRKMVEGGRKNVKVRKRHAWELSAEKATVDMKKKKRKIEANAERMAEELNTENVTLVEKKKKKKEIRNEASANIVQSSLATNCDSGAAVGKDSGMVVDVLHDSQKKADVVSSVAPVEAQQAVNLRKVELSSLVRDLCALALDPFHGVERNCVASTQMVFLKYRSLVYQKSLVSLPPSGNETVESQPRSLLSSTALRGPTYDKSTTKLIKPSGRPIDDPTKGGKKRGPSDRPETIKKKKLLVAGEQEGVNRRIKIVGSEDIKKKKKIIDESKLVAAEKKIPQRSTTDSQQRGDVKIKAELKLESSKRMMEQAVRASNPTMLVMKFPAGATLPSGYQLKAKFARFGPLDLDATRVFWKTYTCRLVYLRKADAQVALESAVGSNSLFGSTNVRCYLRDVRAEAPVELEPVKVHKERESGFEHNSRSAGAAKSGGVQQLKSCLKKPSSNDEGGNGNGRGTRVKFILGGEGSTSSINTHEQLSNFPLGALSHNNAHSMDTTSATTTSTTTSIKSLPKFTPHSSTVTPLPTTTSASTNLQFQKFPIDMPSDELLPRPLNAPPQQIPSALTKDISQQLLGLLTRCSDVVNNVTGILGYMPYHSL